MATYIDLDDDKNNQSKDLTKKLIEKETEKINKTQNIINNIQDPMIQYRKKALEGINNPTKYTQTLFNEMQKRKIDESQVLINNNIYSATDEILKAAQLETTIQETRIKEIQEKILKDNQEEKFKLASMIKPIHFIPSKKSNNPPILNNINITHPPLVFSEKKKKYYENLPGLIVLGTLSSLLAWLILRLLGFA